MSYIERYIKWASKLTIAPKEYHEGTVLAHMSAIVNRNAYVEFSWKKLYPNLWVLIIGQTRISKKSTATDDIGKEKIYMHIPDNELLPSDITPPKLFQIIDIDSRFRQTLIPACFEANRSRDDKNKNVCASFLKVITTHKYLIIQLNA